MIQLLEGSAVYISLLSCYSRLQVVQLMCFSSHTHVVAVDYFLDTKVLGEFFRR